MKREHIALLIASTMLISCKSSPDAVCMELDNSIDTNIRRIAVTLAEGDISDKGAMQQAARYTMAGNHLQVIRLNVDLQIQHGCPVRKGVIDPFIFRTEGLKCLQATYEDSKDAVVKACDIKAWTGTSK